MAQVFSAQPFDKVLAEELAQVQTRRKRVFANGTETAETSHQGQSLDLALRVRPFGLALSGGGIRSATFNLGILHGLAQLDLLKYVDYLSTVSGGGYIGSWLHGLIRNRYNGDPREVTKFLSPTKNPVPKPPDEDSISFLRKYSNYPAPKPTLFSADIWVVVLIWMRNFLLNQLILIPAISALILILLVAGFAHQSPQIILGRLLTDGLLAVAVVAFVLAPLTIAALVGGWNLRRVVARTFESSKEVAESSPVEHWSLTTVLLVFFAALVIGCVRFKSIAALVSGSEWLNSTISNLQSEWVAISLILWPLFIVFQLAGGFFRTYVTLRPDKIVRAKLGAGFHIIWMSSFAAAVSGGLIVATWSYLTNDLNWTPWVRLTFAPTLVCLSLFAGVALLQGLMGSDYPDGAREWISRVGAMILIVCALWTGLFLVAVFGPWAFARLLADYDTVGVTAVGGWLITTVGGVLAGKSAAGPAKDGANGKSILGWLMAIAPTVFMIGYLVLLAFAVHLSLRAITPKAKIAAAKANAAAVQANAKSQNRESTKAEADSKQPSRPVAGEHGSGPQAAGQSKSAWLTGVFEFFETFANDYFYVLAVTAKDPAQLPVWVAATGLSRFLCLLIFIVICVAVTLVMSWRINLNEFSMHHMYKNRLVRCYLGASNSEKRRPNVLTGFDPADDFPLATLVPEGSKPYCGPYPIVNTALNLNAGSELAHQERKAASFVFTPKFCGFLPSVSKEDRREVNKSRGKFEEHGYRSTKGYSCPTGPDLGMAMAISGAAANPNSGYQTSGPMAFLLTVFDARLGWWLGNPRWKGASQYSSPLFALKYLFLELLGQTTGRTKFVNLSDGGHFDNLGLYELVRRRCRYIIICDGEQDGDLTFGSLAGVIRKCRADFGVEIDVNPDPIRIVKNYSTAHCVVGTIEYPEEETGQYAPAIGDGTFTKPQPGEKAKGWLLYLKSSLTGDEPADVIEYRSRFPKFPHESTADQFFSESQFESYRRLGLHIVRDAFDGVPLDSVKNGNGNEEELLKMFQALTRKWYAPIPVTPEAATRLTDAYSSLMRRLGEDKALAALVPELLPNAGTTSPQTSVAGESPIADEVVMTFGLEVIQLIENVYTEFGFEREPNRANPRNAGWIEVFRRWAQGNVFYNQIWAPAKKDYHPLFRQFMDEYLHAGKKEDWPMRS